MKIGETVIYDGVKYKIEKEYCDGVFFIGNKDAFVENVPASQLTLVIDTKEKLLEHFGKPQSNQELNNLVDAILNRGEVGLIQVKCDEETNPPEVVARNELRARITLTLD